jgi:ketosteroid isomerase-like protein
MPPPSNIPALYVLCGLAGNGAQPRPVPSADLADVQLRAINHRFVHAELDPSGDLLDALTGEDFLFTRDDGSWIDRSGFLAERRRTQPVRAGAEDQRVRLFGNVALVHSLYHRVDRHSGTAWLRCTDVHLWTGGHWRLLSVQETLLANGAVPPELQSASAPAHAPWHGQDPTGDDVDVLHTLNDQYVEAYRNADVAWYDAHLAMDYLVASGDGSFHDRASALARFARPSFALHFTSFPVGKVTIRRYIDVALIHAENAYEMKDGRRGVSRYTDIWHRRNGAWRCISAHITEHQAPTAIPTP